MLLLFLGINKNISRHCSWFFVCRKSTRFRKVVCVGYHLWTLDASHINSKRIMRRPASCRFSYSNALSSLKLHFVSMVNGNSNDLSSLELHFVSIVNGTWRMITVDRANNNLIMIFMLSILKFSCMKWMKHY